MNCIFLRWIHNSIAQLVKLMMVLAIFGSYTIQFYVRIPKILFQKKKRNALIRGHVLVWLQDSTEIQPFATGKWQSLFWITRISWLQGYFRWVTSSSPWNTWFLGANENHVAQLGFAFLQPTVPADGRVRLPHLPRSDDVWATISLQFNILICLERWEILRNIDWVSIACCWLAEQF